MGCRPSYLWYLYTWTHEDLGGMCSQEDPSITKCATRINLSFFCFYEGGIHWTVECVSVLLGLKESTPWIHIFLLIIFIAWIFMGWTHGIDPIRQRVHSEDYITFCWHSIALTFGSDRLSIIFHCLFLSAVHSHPRMEYLVLIQSMVIVATIPVPCQW